MAACVKMDNNYFWRRNFSSNASPPKADNASMDGSGTEMIAIGVNSAVEVLPLVKTESKPIMSTNPVGTAAPPSAAAEE